MVRTKLIAALALLPLLFSACTHTPPPPADVEVADRPALFLNLRRQVLTSSRATLGLEPRSTPTTPWGVVRETGLPSGTFTLVALADGNASIYLGHGRNYTGGGNQEPIRNSARSLVLLAGRFQSQATATNEFPLPALGQTTFYLLTDAGVFTASAPEAALLGDAHPWSPLARASQELITLYRAFEERKP